MRPLDSVNDPGFINLIRVLEPRYDLKNRTHVTNKLIPFMYEETRKQVEQLLSKCELFALTTDGWTSRSAKGFITVTAHVIDESWQLKELVLRTAEMSESHTAENLSEHMRSVAADWKIDLHSTVITTDNAANIVSAIERCDVTAHVRCMAHVLNLATQKGLTKVSSLSRLLGRVRSLVNFFHRSVLASNALCKTLRQLEIPDLRPIIDASFCWNSTYDMKERHLKIRPAITAAFSLNELKNESHRDTMNPKYIADLEAITAVSSTVAATAFSLDFWLLIMIFSDVLDLECDENIHEGVV